MHFAQSKNINIKMCVCLFVHSSGPHRHQGLVWDGIPFPVSLLPSCGHYNTLQDVESCLSLKACDHRNSDIRGEIKHRGDVRVIARRTILFND